MNRPVPIHVPASWTESTYRRLLDAAPDAMLVVDSSGLIVLANAQAEAVFGYTRRELVGASLESLVPERFRHRHARQVTEFFAGPQLRAMGGVPDLRALRKDGVEFPADISLSPLETEDGVLVIAAIRDISDRKRTEKQIQELNHELQARVAELAANNKELEAFSYSVSHDLRAPLRQIDGFSKIALMEHPETVPAELAECLEQIRQGTRQMVQLIDDLLNFSRLGRQELMRQPVNLAALLEAVMREFQAETDSRDVRWETEVLPVVECDFALTRQVFRNLLSNALKFSRGRSPAVISVGRQQQNEETILYVRDNGVGFDMEHAERLFGVFQRLHVEDQFEGTGVGLAVVQRIVNRHGGRIWAEARPDRGATFYFTLGSERSGGRGKALPV